MLKETAATLHKQGYSYNQIAQTLNCSKGTVAYHLGTGQLEKTRKRQANWRKTNVLANKLSRFRNRKARTKAPPRDRSTSGRIRDFYFKVLNFQRSNQKANSSRRRPCMGIAGTDYMKTFTTEEARKKFEGRTCYLSGMPVNLDDGSTYELDHVKSVARGGSYELSNCDITNPVANLMKGEMEVDEFLWWVFKIADYNENHRSRVLAERSVGVEPT